MTCLVNVGCCTGPVPRALDDVATPRGPTLSALVHSRPKGACRSSLNSAAARSRLLPSRAVVCARAGGRQHGERSKFAAVQPGGEGRAARLRLGLVGIDVGTGDLVGSTIQEQTRQALTNCEAVLRA